MLMPSVFSKNVFDDFFDDFAMPQWKAFHNITPSAVMRTDVKENEKDYEISMELPGFKKEDVEAELKDGYLIISAKNETESEDADKDNFIHKERYVGSCKRSFYVGENVKEEDISAKFENGILMMTVPKKPKEAIEEKKYIAIAG